MVTDEPSFALAVAKAGCSARATPLRNNCEEWMRECGAPPSLISFFQKHSYSSWVQIGAVSFNSANEIVQINTEPQNHALYKAGLLIVGSGLNGDPIAINLKNGNVGFLCHDELWEHDGVVDFAALYRELPESIGSFYLAAANSEQHPVDFYQASESRGGP